MIHSKNIDNISLIKVSQKNVGETGIYCIKDQKSPGYKAKIEWFKKRLNEGLEIRIAVNAQGKQLGFVEFIPSELAWRPIKTSNFLFIQCIALFVKDAKRQGVGSTLIHECIRAAKHQDKSGVCAMSSDGRGWLGKKYLPEMDLRL